MDKKELKAIKYIKEARTRELNDLYEDILDVLVKHDNYMVSFDNLFEDAMDKCNNEWDSDFRKMCDICTSTYKGESDASYGWMRTAAFMLAWQLMHGKM